MNIQPPPGLNAGMVEKIMQMRAEMLRAQEELAGERLVTSVGGGAVTVVIDGRQHIHEITLSPEALAQGDKDMLQDLLVAAMNQAIEQSQTLAAERLQNLPGGLGLPEM
jgi:nucleoid-associated protein EbfC